MVVVESIPSQRKRSALIAGTCLMIGVVLAYMWSYRFVDDVIAGNIGRALLNDGLHDYALVGTSTFLVFAFVSGLAGTFTACNVCVLSAALPLAGQRGRSTLVALRAFLLSLISVSGAYGSIGVLVAPSLPQLSQSTLGTAAMPLRLVQAGVVFVLLGIVMLLWGFAILRQRGAGAKPASVAAQVALGAMVAAFQVGRPFPPFRRMFSYAAEQGDVLLGASAFILQAVGNVILLLVVVAFLSAWRSGTAIQWMTAYPQRRAIAVSAGFLIGGAFMVAYWGIRIPAHFYFSY